jgi:hypothetical protein
MNRRNFIRSGLIALAATTGLARAFISPDFLQERKPYPNEFTRAWDLPKDGPATYVDCTFDMYGGMHIHGEGQLPFSPFIMADWTGGKPHCPTSYVEHIRIV